MPHVLPEWGVERHARQVPRQLGLVAREKPFDSLPDEVTHSARLHRDHRQAGGPRLQRGQPERFPLARQDEAMYASIERPEIRPRELPEQLDAIAYTQLSREATHRL